MSDVPTFFANGAVTAAFLQTTVEAAELYKEVVGWEADITPAEKLYIDPATGKCCRYPEGTRPGPAENRGQTENPRKTGVGKPGSD